jgi:hypothetical protein
LRMQHPTRPIWKSSRLWWTMQRNFTGFDLSMI